ncbi:uncharacterized protein LOC131060862 [Cryptomeria japonica]|uniref:uncharacterized protein LOC131060862 n=1 Tax=Cryptomeria japonica TaxID=3369 RepID=UPI0025ABCFBB|nr:uncharacterized protein LOC131060862 [Cryptomeria japonica]
MKNVYRKGKVHPQPAPDAYSVLRLLPVAVATLSAALPAEDREVLAYLIARSPDVLPLKDNRRNTLPLSSLVEKEKASQQFPWSHGPSFECSCFQCYTSFWSRWDASPNRQTIHEAIDLYEEHMAARADAAKGNSKGKNRKGFKDKNPRHSSCADESFPPPVANDKSVVSVVQIEEEALKAALKLKQIVPPEEDAEHKEEESSSGRGRDSPPPPPPPLTIGGRGIMRRVFPNIMTFIADHLWTAWTSPTGPEQ